MTAQDRPRPVGEIVDRLSLAADRERVPLRALLEVFGESSFLPALMVPALLVVSPLSGIPLFSTVCGLSIAFIAAQMLVSRDHLWLPDILLRQQMDGPVARKALGKLRHVSDWIDAHSRRRFRVLTSAPFRKWLQLLCFLCGAVMPFLELVPFSSSLLGGAVLLLATALLARDGLFALLGSLAICLAIFVPLSVLGIV
ncbi:exopolysaccharide biosynthesis protein [Salipiger abyssi]|uniref:exopolysaccharide biosynthesis protein n=1 Tax=Salipiger abyssi TaxID=1250539 RepID=UPI001A8E4C32|nr:exopolysaccharide biosynthesis protein [Salipiger abyssi]MBN9885985.1 exopolysaccharide biosynthesis protein [Salipiger abyssi]